MWGKYKIQNFYMMYLISTRVMTTSKCHAYLEGKIHNVNVSNEHTADDQQKLSSIIKKERT